MAAPAWDSAYNERANAMHAYTPSMRAAFAVLPVAADGRTRTVQSDGFRRPIQAATPPRARRAPPSTTPAPEDSGCARADSGACRVAHRGCCARGRAAPWRPRCGARRRETLTEQTKRVREHRISRIAHCSARPGAQCADLLRKRRFIKTLRARAGGRGGEGTVASGDATIRGE